MVKIVDVQERPYIQVTTHHLPIINTEYRTYEWIGKKTDAVEIPIFMEKLVKEMPWPLVKVPNEYDFPRGTSTYVRTDVVPGLALFYRLKYWFRETRWQLKSRIIATFMVWGLAWTDEAMVPQWSDIGKKPPAWRR